MKMLSEIHQQPAGQFARRCLAFFRQHDPSGLLRGCRRSYRYAAENRDEWADFGAHYFRISRQTMTKSIEREFSDLHFDCAVDIEGLATALTLQRKLGAVTTPLSLSDIMDPRFTTLLAVS